MSYSALSGGIGAIGILLAFAQKSSRFTKLGKVSTTFAMSITYSTSQMMKVFGTLREPTQLRLQQKGDRIFMRNGGSGGFSSNRSLTYKASIKKLQVTMCYPDETLQYSAQDTTLGSNVQTQDDTQDNIPGPQIPDSNKKKIEISSGLDLIRVKSSVDIYEYLLSKFGRDDGTLDIVSAMVFLESMISVFTTLQKVRKRNLKISKTYELLFEDLTSQLSRLSTSDKVICMKSLGVANSVVYASTLTFQKGLQVFELLLEDVLNNKDDLSSEEVSTVANAVINFKQYNDREKILQVLSVIRNKFLEVPNDEKFVLLDIVRLMRCIDEPIVQSLEKGIQDGTLVPTSQENVKQVLQFLGAVGKCDDTRILHTLASYYAQLPAGDHTNIGYVIFNLAWLGAQPELIQNLVDTSLGNADESELEVLKQRFHPRMFRRANYLLAPIGGSIQYPQSIQDVLEEGSQAQRSGKNKLNPKSAAVNKFLTEQFKDCELEDCPVTEGEMGADMSIKKGDKKVAIATRLSTSFTYTEPRKLLGHTKATFQQQENKGWKVYVVDGDKFDVDQDYGQEIVEELRNILEREDLVESNWKFM